ncbi:MAG TPA: queuosine precursor transporter [Thermomicrobiaceae bacterium]|nr:queuosine precursor transporter [Thermomicrobiaceae bacterium]
MSTGTETESRSTGGQPEPRPRLPSETRGGVSPLFAVIVGLFVTSLITANIVAVKLVDVGGFTVPAGTITLFPLSYIFGDVLTEVYGFRQARRVIWLGFACNLLAVLAIYLTQVLPAPGYWNGQAAYERILGYTPRLLGASFAAYLVGEFANSFVLARMKIMTGGRWLWSRTIGSTLIGEGFDSIFFITIAFIGTIPARALGDTIVTAWLFKSGYEIVMTPVTYLVVGYLKRVEQSDVFDVGTSFSPLSLK